MLCMYFCAYARQTNSEGFYVLPAQVTTEIKHWFCVFVCLFNDRIWELHLYFYLELGLGDLLLYWLNIFKYHESEQKRLL